MTSRSRWTPLFAVLTLLPLAACAAEEGGEMEEAEGEAMEEQAPEPAEEAAAMEPVTITLDAKNESGVTGEATATHHADSVTVEVNVMGAAGDGTFPAHVHAGDCAAPGGVLAPLTPLEVLGGNGGSTTTLAVADVPRDQGAVIQVHDSSGAPVACGDLMGHGEMDGMEDGEGMEGDTTGM